MAELAITGEGRRAAWRRFDPVASLTAAFAAEGERRALWLPVFFGIGIALYFSLMFEPPRWWGIAALGASVTLAVGVRQWPAWRSAGIALAFAAAGFAVMQQARVEHGTPMLERRIGAAAITGTVVDIDALDRGWRIVVAPDPIPGLAASELPRRLRIHIPETSDRLEPGDRVGFKAKLYPVPPQIMPDARDMQRELYFAGIGGVGYSFGGARKLGAADAASGGWREWLLRLRAEMTNRINAALPGTTGGVASAVITGKRGTMDETVKQSFRDSGLSHLLAIAGLHLGLVGGFVFFTVRGGLALFPWLALRFPIKKIAASVTLLVLFCYLLISGAAIPTERAFVMNGIVFAAILIDRMRLSMRICALAALVVLLLDPASLVGVSFQMSFGAVVALVAVYETWGARLGHLFHRGSFARKALGYCGAVAVTTCVATLGTEPFAIYHFHHLVLYSPLANVLAVPISALWTLPWGVVACLLMPFGLERLALAPMGWGIDATIAIAQWVAVLPGNVWATPRLPTVGAVLVALGGCWLCLWQGRWRLWGTFGIAAGLATMLFTRPPDLILGDFGRFLAARAADGDYFIADSTEDLTRSFLAQETGAALLAWPRSASAGPLDCSAAGRCSYAANGRRVALITDEAGLPVLCYTVDAIVAQVPAGFVCRSQIPVADRIDSWRQGSIALWLDHDRVSVESTNASRGDRPWVPHPVSARERAARAAARTDR
ncbi:MAG TPA: ComEC/Rec2 family competence protein [Stellaceae bacterium]|jgi:competence protein ComEC|nr:ComEC/Rec2 family competence protein [Stellaceae bacterium]